MPGDGEYDRGERKELGNELKLIFGGCTIVVLIVVMTFVVYGILLVRSGWHG